jgi:thioredoxin 1
LISPLIDQLADAYQDRATVMKLDLDNHKAIAKRFELRSIPAVMYFKAGELSTTLVGVKPYEDFQTALESLL